MDPTGPVAVANYGSEEYGELLGERPVLITPDGAARILPPGATPTEHPDTMGIVGEWDRDGIMRRFVGRKDWSVAVKASAAEAAEWDHVALTLSRQEGEQATPEQMKAAVAILTDVLRTPPLRFTRDGDPETYQRWLAEKRITRGDVLGIDGTRMVHVLPVHDDTDNVHVQAFVHRHPIDVDKREVGAAIKQHENIVTRAQVAALNALFEANGLPFRVVNGFERVTAGPGAVLDTDQAADLVQSIEAAGGVAPARLTTGQQGQLTGGAAVAGISPDRQKIRGSIDTKTARLARIESERAELAAEIAAEQHAEAAIARAEVAEVERDAALDRAEAAEQQAQETAAELVVTQQHLEQESTRATGAEAERDAQAARAEAAETALAAAQATIAEEPLRVAAAVETALDPVRQQLAEANEEAEAQRDARSKAEGELEDTWEKLNEANQENENLTSELAAAQARAEAAESALAHERETFVERATAWADANLVAPVRQRAEAVEAALTAARDQIAAFPAAMEAEIDRRMKAMEDRLQASFDRMMATAQAGFQSALEAKDAVIASLRTAAAAPLYAVSDAAGRAAERVAPTPAPAQPEQPTQRRPAPGRDFVTVAPEQWSTEQRRYAERVLTKLQQEGKVPQGVTVEDYGQRVHDDWRKNQPGSTPPTPRPGPRRS
jgi:hypothetical protein